jgi:DNA-binding response OmpR family regulator
VAVKRGTVLVVDDDAASAEAMGEFMEREGFQVISAATAQEALEAYRRARPIAILLDWELPDAPGSEVCREVRAQDQEVVMIFITGRSDETSIARGLDAGADDYIVKPVRRGELVARVEANLHRVARLRSRAAPAAAASPGPAAHVVSLGPIRVDLSAREVTVDGQSVRLGPLEYALLEYLANNAGVAISRDQIMAEVWGYDADIGTERVDLMVRRLRAKLGEAAGSLIAAVPGYGYRLERR